MERIISDERLQSIVRRAYRAGRGGVEAFTQVGADGPEVIRCRDCKHARRTSDGKAGWCAVNRDEDGFCLNVMDDGFCAWAERRDA